MAGEQGPGRELGMSGWLRPCTGRRTASEEEEVPSSMLPVGTGHARPIHGTHAPAAKETKEALLTGAKMEAEKGDKAAAAAGFSEEGADWVEMPEHHVRWILAQKRERHAVPPIEEYDPFITNKTGEVDYKSTCFSKKNIDEQRELFSSLHTSLQASHTDFFAYQDWVRSVYEGNGRVMVPASLVAPRDEMQKEINNLWAQFKEEYAMDHADDSDFEGDDDCAVDGIADSNTKELPRN